MKFFARRMSQGAYLQQYELGLRVRFRALHTVQAADLSLALLAYEVGVSIFWKTKRK